MPPQPQSFVSDCLTAASQCVDGEPVAFILPTTSAVLEVVNRYRQLGELTIVAGTSVPDSPPISSYLRACYTLGDDWLARGMQHLRNPESRRHSALRKLRFFRSAVVNAYRTEPASVEVAQLLQRITHMEQKAQQETAA